MKNGNFTRKLMGKLRYLYPQMRSSKAIYCVVTILRSSTVGKGGFTGVHLWMSVSGLGWTGVVSVPGRRSNISSRWEWMDYRAEGELINLPLMSSTHSGLLLCLGKIQLPQQLRCLTWALLGVSAVRAAAGVTEKCAIPSAEKEDLELGQSLFYSKNVHLCHNMFGYVGSFFLLSPTRSFKNFFFYF